MAISSVVSFSQRRCGPLPCAPFCFLPRAPFCLAFFFIRLCVYGMDAVATHFSVGSSQKKQNKRSRFFRPFSFRSFHIRHRVLRRARVPRRWFLVDPCSFFLFFFTVASNPSVDREREREKVIKQKDGARMDPMDVNVEAGSAARWRRLKISRFNGGSSFTWLPNFFWGFFLVFGFVWLFFFFVLVPAPGARGHETNPIVAVDRRFYSVALSLSLSHRGFCFSTSTYCL